MFMTGNGSYMIDQLAHRRLQYQQIATQGTLAEWYCHSTTCRSATNFGVVEVVQITIPLYRRTRRVLLVHHPKCWHQDIAARGVKAPVPSHSRDGEEDSKRA